MRPMTKSPMALAQKALQIAHASLAPYSHKKSRRDFTQRQHFTMLVLKRFLRVDFRGMVQMLAEWSDLRRLLELKKVPHWTTLEKAEKRLIKKGLSRGCKELFSKMPRTAA